MNYSLMLFDLDETLYDGNSGVWSAIVENIYRYMIERMHIPADEVHPLREELFNTYGTTMKGLEATRGLDKRDYLEFVHNIPVQQFLSPDDILRNLLKRYHSRRVIFTNADASHAERVTRALGIRDLFEEIMVDIMSIDPYCKPMPQAFEIARTLTGDLPVEEIVFIDDSLPNVQSAYELGFQVVWLNKKKREISNLPFPMIDHIHELATVLPPDGRE